jgi:pimeloyl-ACP methyl ester carboxylesterase
MSSPGDEPDLHGLHRDIVDVSPPDLPRSGPGGHAVQGLYYRPVGVMPEVALIATHYAVDFSEHYLADFIAHRGLGFLGWNIRYRGNEHNFLLDRALLDIGVGVRWLREHGVRKVVLLGNSGGASLMAAYQAQTARPVLRPAPGLELVDGLDGLPGGDLYVSVAAHEGRPDVLTKWLDPSVLDESDPVGSDPELDMYDEANGPPYAPEFVARYREAQRARNRRITQWAKQELERRDRAGYGDRVFHVPRTWADLRFMDPAIDPSDRPPRTCYAGDPAVANRRVLGLAAVNTLRSWLSMWSLDESQARAEEHLPAIDLPALVVSATEDTGCFPSDAQAIHDGLGSTDKQLVHLRGDHYFRNIPGARAALADLIAGWIAERAG